MIILDSKKYAEIHNDYKGTYSSDEIHGTKFNGKKTWVKWIENVGTCLLIEDKDFKLVDVDQDGFYEVECNECDGDGSWEHGPECNRRASECCGGCYITVQCENCEGSGIEKIEYESELI